MRHRADGITGGHLLLGGTIFCLLAAIAAPRAGGTVQPALELIVEIGNLRSASGEVLLALFSSQRGFPGKQDEAIARGTGRISNGRATIRLPGLRPGRYAISAFHDENGNRKLDRDWRGVPKEGVAFSNDPKVSSGPPSFEAAAFRLEEGRERQVLQMQYVQGAASRRQRQPPRAGR